jgi:hypothetical protein
MTMSSGPAAGTLAAGEDLTAARGFTGPLAFVCGLGGKTALDRGAAGFLGDAGGAARSTVLAFGFGAAFFSGPDTEPAGSDTTGGFLGTADLAAAGSFAGFPGTADSAAAGGLAGFRGAGFGDWWDPGGIKCFFAIDLSGA